MFIQLHVICIFMLFMKRQDVHNDWFMWRKARNVMRTCKYCDNICLRISRAAAVEENVYKIMECQNIEWSSTRRGSSNILQYSNYIQDWPQKIMESETGLIFQASTPKSTMKEYMILNFTEAIAAQDAFPRRATVLFRRDSHWTRDNSCVWRRCWTWFRRWSFGSSDHTVSHRGVDWFSNLLQPKEFRIVTAVIVWN